MFDYILGSLALLLCGVAAAGIVGIIIQELLE